MVEMRWVPASERKNYNATIIDSGNQRVVLQYRQYSLDTSRSPVASWSEWIDVPTVTEP